MWLIRWPHFFGPKLGSDNRGYPEAKLWLIREPQLFGPKFASDNQRYFKAQFDSLENRGYLGQNLAHITAAILRQNLVIKARIWLE